MSSVLSGCDFVAGWASGIVFLTGICGLLVGHPLDTIKVWKQTIPENTSSTKVILTLFKLEGIRGFYKGMMFPLITAGALNSLFFGVYGNSMRILQDFRQVDVSRTGIYYPQWHLDVFCSGCTGGLMTIFITCPVELVKTQMQTQTRKPNLVTQRVHQYRGPWDCLVDQYRSRGIRGCYRGIVPTFWRDVPAFGMYVLTYEQFMYFRGQHRANKDHLPGLSNQIIGGALAGASGLYMLVYAYTRQLLSDSHVWAIMLAGANAGLLSWASVVPLDVIKSRIQADSKSHPQFKGMIDCAIQSYRHDGIQVFFRGFWIVVLRALPVNAVTFVGYECFISFCESRKKALVPKSP